MDIGYITPPHIYRMWGGRFSIEEIEKGLMEIRKQVRVSTTQRSRFTVDRLGKATAKYDDWPCFLEIMRLELTALIFVTTRPLPSKL